MPRTPSTVLPLALVSLFLAAHAVVPLVGGDLYPFTSAPMFRDKPERYCNYHIFAPDGIELPPEAWLVQRVYDGNPVGYGVGIRPLPVIEQEFGAVHDEQNARQHILGQFKNLPAAPPSVVVEQWIYGPHDDGTIMLMDRNSWRVDRPTP